MRSALNPFFLVFVFLLFFTDWGVATTAALETIIDARTGVRVAIPVDIVGRDSTTKPWGSNWGFRAANLSIDTFNFGNTRTLPELFSSMKNKPGRNVTSGELKSDSFYLRGTDDRGTTQFYLQARLGNGEIRGLSVAYDTSVRTRLEPVVADVISSFEPFPPNIAAVAKVAPAAPPSINIPPPPQPTALPIPPVAPTTVAKAAPVSAVATSDPLVCPAVEAKGMRIALVIGNSKYQSARSLPNAKNDANAMTLALRELGFKVVSGVDLDKRSMELKIRDFKTLISQANGQPLALVFYAGHGIQVADRNYLIPTDAKLEQVTDLELDGIDLNLVLRQMAWQTTCVNLVLLDACRNDPFVERVFKAARQTRGDRAPIPVGFAPIREKPRETYIVFSTEPNAFAEDGTGDNSPFTDALLKNIFKPGLDFQLIMRAVRNDVTIATDERQRPTEYGDITKSVILLQKPRGTAAAAGNGVGGPITRSFDEK